jgi:cytochrome c oxidase assembly protein subunit 11
MPVVFYIDPEIVGDRDVANLGTITLSYTFYPVEPPARISQAGGAIPDTAQQPY